MQKITFEIKTAIRSRAAHDDLLELHEIIKPIKPASMYETHLGLDVLALDDALVKNFGRFDNSMADFTTEKFGPRCAELIKALISPRYHMETKTGYQSSLAGVAIHKQGKLWNISHIESGVAMETGYNTRKLAVKAIDAITHFGIDWTKPLDNLFEDYPNIQEVKQVLINVRHEAYND